MKHNEQARVAPLDFALNTLFVQKESSEIPGLVRLTCSLRSAWSLVSCSLYSVLITVLDFAHVHAAPANSALFLPQVSLFCFEFSLGRLRRLGAPPQRELEAKKIDLREKQGAVGGRRVHVGKIKYRDQHRAEQARFA